MLCSLLVASRLLAPLRPSHGVIEAGGTLLITLNLDDREWDFQRRLSCPAVVFVTVSCLVSQASQTRLRLRREAWAFRLDGLTDCSRPCCHEARLLMAERS